MKATGKRCRHCGGNIISSYDNYSRPRNFCLQCGRDTDHCCGATCRELKKRPARPLASVAPSRAVDGSFGPEWPNRWPDREVPHA
jgi:hypothetical protein